MPLPILHDRTPLSREDLLRLYHRTELHWTQQLGTEETLLDVGVAIFNPDFPQVWDANIVFDAALPDGVAPNLAVAEGEEFFRSRGGMCRMWVVNPSLSPDRTQPLADYLVSAGYVKGGYDVLHLGSSPSSPVREIAGLTIIPARASFKHAQELAKVAAKEWGRDQLGDALLMHLEDPQTDGLIALKDGVAVAFVTVLTVGEMGCIENLFVVESHRRQGIGRTMLSRAMEICARSLFKHVFIGVSPTNVAAASLYKQFGFEKIGEHVYYAIKS